MKRSPDLDQKIIEYLPPHGLILDVGCGDSAFLKGLSGKGYELVGVDPCVDESVDLLTPDLQLLKGVGELLPLADSLADVIVMQCVFSLCQPEQTLAELHRVLKPGGLLIVTDLTSGTETVKIPFGYGNGIRMLYTKEDLEKLFQKHFSLKFWSDEKRALLEMLIQAIFDDAELCISQDERAFLKEHKAGYGFWVWERN